jgi:hypothetical protein
MKSKYNNVRLILATAAFGVLASFAHAGPPPEGWNRTKEIKTFTEAKAVGTDATIAISCDKCKTSLIREARHTGPGKGPDPMFTIGAKHTCDECKGEITVVKGKTTDSMQMNCTKCGEGSVHCSASMPAMK